MLGLILFSMVSFIRSSLASGPTPSATITPGPSLTKVLLKRTGDPSFEGYTSAYGSWSPLYCDSGSTFKTFQTLAACCPTSGNCNPATECNANLAFLQNGNVQTCSSADCNTGLIYSTLGDPSPQHIVGCWDIYKLYRTIDKAASTSIAATATGVSSSSPSTTSAGVAPSKSSSSGTSHVGIIAGAVVVVVVFIVIIAGLAAYVCMLRKKGGADRKPAASTELTQMDGTAGGGTVGNDLPMKAELPTAEGNAYELAPNPAKGQPNPSQGQNYYHQHQQQAWTAHTPVQPYPAMELPTRMNERRSGKWSSYQELAG